MTCMRFGSIFLTAAALAGCGSDSPDNPGTGGAEASAGGVPSTGGASASGGMGGVEGSMNLGGTTSNAVDTGGTQGGRTGANGGSGAALAE